MAQNREFRRYQTLLNPDPNLGNDSDVNVAKKELHNAPFVWWNVKKYMEQNDVGLKQYAVMGCEVAEKSDEEAKSVIERADTMRHSSIPISSAVLQRILPPGSNEEVIEATKEAYANQEEQEYKEEGRDATKEKQENPQNQDNLGNIEPVLLNTNSPWSAFLCGLQGSGKSHALSCILEGCLMNDPVVGKNPNPLAGIVFHYDPSHGNRVCEAAYLCSSIKTRVLVSASNYKALKQEYEKMAESCGGKIQVQILDLDSSQLNTERMKTLMAVGKESEPPLYMSVVANILREMAVKSGGIGTFDYRDFTRQIAKAGLTDAQLGPLYMRLDLLESYVDLPPRPIVSRASKGQVKLKEPTHTPRKPKGQPDFLLGSPKTLTIVDLTDPIIDSDAACVMFNICLAIFVSQTNCGKIIALDEAHKYMGERSAAESHFTERLLKTIREQRHQGARIVIATQEPTINPRLLDLCNLTMVHRFASPAWYAVLKQHIAALQGRSEADVIEQIGQLKTGECLLFCPMAAIGMRGNELLRLDTEYRKFRTRRRITADGGKSKLADGSHED
ncbi:hypothetical protein PTT_09544 [Pyrenophora teres f. teres 0-1]|uniref:Uncharacterized protein n=2 Tax=Pyrenophora teres f. teres TaxID=97479 RepID=E3RM89_PYRTT|nr:hypothetical protein PTT_09544 [Pyrenophora teres f. teres 0-1]